MAVPPATVTFDPISVQSPTVTSWWITVLGRMQTWSPMTALLVTTAPAMTSTLRPILASGETRAVGCTTVAKRLSGTCSDEIAARRPK